MMQTWWLSFCDTEKPAGQQFLGVVIVDVDETDAQRAERMASDPGDRMRAAAIWKSHRQHCNPGGAVVAHRVDELAPPEELATCPRNRLLSRAELETLDVIGTNLDGDLADDGELSVTITEQLRDLANSVVHYDELIQEVSRQRVLSGGGLGAAAWSVDGALGEQLDAAYFEVMKKARAALGR